MKNLTLFLLFCTLSSALLAQSAWQQLSPPDRYWAQVAVASPDVIYAVNKIWGPTFEEPVLIRSADGGASWDSVNTFYIMPFGLEFWDENNGHILGGVPSCGLYAGMTSITDGGQNLINRDYYNEFYATNTANLQTAADAFGAFYITGADANVYHTSDTGATLQPILALDDPMISLQDVHFVSPTQGFVCGYKMTYNPDINDYDYMGLLYRTTNGGTDWAVDAVENAKFMFLGFVGTDVGFALSGSKLLQITEGGQVLTALDLPFVAENFQVLDAQHLVAIDAAGDVWESLDAAQTWLPSLIGHGIRDIQCAHSQCLVGGDMGAMFKASYTSGSVEVQPISFDVSPNPASQHIQFTAAEMVFVAYTITDITGKVIASGTTQSGATIDISHLPSANYVFTAQGLGSKTIIIQR